MKTVFTTMKEQTLIQAVQFMHTTQWLSLINHYLTIIQFIEMEVPSMCPILMSQLTALFFLGIELIKGVEELYMYTCICITATGMEMQETAIVYKYI